MFQDVLTIYKADQEGFKHNQRQQALFQSLFVHDDEQDDILVLERNLHLFNKCFREVLGKLYQVMPQHSHFMDQYVKIVHFGLRTLVI